MHSLKTDHDKRFVASTKVAWLIYPGRRAKNRPWKCQSVESMESHKTGFPPFPHSVEIPSGFPHSHGLDDWIYVFSCPLNSNHRHRKGLVTDVSGPQRNTCPGTLTPEEGVVTLLSARRRRRYISVALRQEQVAGMVAGAREGDSFFPLYGAKVREGKCQRVFYWLKLSLLRPGHRSFFLRCAVVLCRTSRRRPASTMGQGTVVCGGLYRSRRPGAGSRHPQAMVRFFWCSRPLSHPKCSPRSCCL